MSTLWERYNVMGKFFYGFGGTFWERKIVGWVGTNFNEILIKILTFSFIKMRLKVSSVKWHPFCLGLNVLTE